MLPIETENPLFGRYLYSEANDLRERQQDIMWFASEIKVEDDVQDYKIKMSPLQYNAVTVLLQSFVEIEQTVGDVWTEIEHWFPHSELQGCSSCFAAIEKSVHSFFYQKMSDVLNIDPEVIAKNQANILVIKKKLSFLKEVTSNLSDNKPLTLATVAMVEQVLLFSNFAVLKSFRANGNNLIKHTVTGVDYVCNDETIHGDYATYLFQTYLQEWNPTPEERTQLNSDILNVTEEVVKHELSVLGYIFDSNETINDISEADVMNFIKSRANAVLANLGMPPHYEIGNNPIPDWFYRGVNSIKMHDFFSSGTNSYRRGWSEVAFDRIKHIKADKDAE